MNIRGGLFEDNHGAPESKIQEAETAVGLKFPATYRNFISKSDGKWFKKQLVEVLSLKKSVEYHQSLREFGITQTWGYFPIVDNQDSNPWCLCCNTPLTGYIIQVLHDDSAQIKFRNIECLVDKIQASDRNDALLLDDLESDFQSSERTSQDVTVARELVKNASNYKGVDRNDACRFAVWLFGEEHVEQIALFLDDEDAFVARDAFDRLKAMRSAKAKEAIREAKRNLANFVEKAMTLLKQARIQATLLDESTVRLESGGILLDMKSFFSLRKNPDAEQKFIERVEFFIANKQRK